MGAVTVTIGIDIGPKVDPTAIAVVEQERRRAPEDGRSDDHYLLRHLERLSLGTAYPQVAERVAEIAGGVRQQTGATAEIYADATGVGQPVVDLLEERGVRVHACYFTHGDRLTEEAARLTIGKAFLVSRLQALLQTTRIHLPKTAEAEALARELLDYEIRISADANDRYGAFKVGSHDDLVTALGLAVLLEPPGRGVW